MSLNKRMNTMVWRISPKTVGAPAGVTVAALGPPMAVKSLLVSW